MTVQEAVKLVRDTMFESGTFQAPHIVFVALETLIDAATQTQHADVDASQR